MPTSSFRHPVGSKPNIRQSFGKNLSVGGSTSPISTVDRLAEWGDVHG